VNLVAERRPGDAQRVIAREVGKLPFGSFGEHQLHWIARFTPPFSCYLRAPKQPTISPCFTLRFFEINPITKTQLFEMGLGD